MTGSGAYFWIGFLCLLEWGLIHIFAGAATVYNAYKPDIHALLTGICSGAPEDVQQEALSITTWNAMNIRILIQHGLNLAFVGVWATALAIVLLVKTDPIPETLFWMCLWPWCADIAYFYAIDTVNYGVLFTESQTVIISVGVWCVGNLVKAEYPNISTFHSVSIVFFPLLLITCSVVNKIVELRSKGNDEL